MRKMLFALAMSVAGAFAFAGASPASAMTAGPVTGLGDVVQSGGATEKVTYWGGYCYEYPWRCRRRHYYWGHHYRPYYRPHYYYRHHYRPWWW